MDHLKTFQLFENEKPVISYDFDGVMHTHVTGIDPVSFTDVDSWTPHEEMHRSLKEDAKTHRIVITTARHPSTNKHLWEFIKRHDLPVEEIYATDLGDKLPYLKECGAIKHYDDRDMTEELEGSGVEFILVKQPEVTEAAQQGKNFEITFKNPKFYISDPTIKAFINQLKKIDRNLIHEPKRNGKIPHGRIIYIKSKALQQTDIKPISLEFRKKYDNLDIVTVVKKYY